MRRNCIFLFVLILLFPTFSLKGQKYDYRLEESPVISWNGITLFDARMLSLGGVSIAALDNNNGIINPAVLPGKEGFTFGGSYSYLKYQSFQFWGVNEGVVKYDSPLEGVNSGFSSFAVMLKFKNAGISGGWYRRGINEFPQFNFRTEYDYEEYNSYLGEFSGNENSYFLCAGISLGKFVDLGLKIDYVKGKRYVNIQDYMSYYYHIDGNWVKKDIYVEQSESHITKDFVPSLGVVIKISQRFISGLTLSYPFRGSSDREILRKFYNIDDRIEIEESEFSEDKNYMPPKISLGFSYHLPLKKILSDSDHLNIFFGFDYSFWSAYKYHFFGEMLERSFKNTFTLSGGVEFHTILNNIDFLLRGGFSFDNQPLKNPDTMLNLVSCGIGIRYLTLGLDFGFAYITASPGGFKQEHLVAVTNFSINISGEKK